MEWAVQRNFHSQTRLGHRPEDAASALRAGTQAAGKDRNFGSRRLAPQSTTWNASHGLNFRLKKKPRGWRGDVAALGRTGEESPDLSEMLKRRSVSIEAGA